MTRMNLLLKKNIIARHFLLVISAESLPIILGGAGGYNAAGLPGAIAGASLPIIGQAVMRSSPVQSLLTNPATTLGQLSRITPGLLAQYQDQ